MWIKRHHNCLVFYTLFVLLNLLDFALTFSYLNKYHRNRISLIVLNNELSMKDTESNAWTSDFPTRRNHLVNFISAAAGILSSSVLIPAFASEDEVDLTTKMFNSDGSLKQRTDTEARFRTIDLAWNESDSSLFAYDGVNAPGISTGSSVNLRYKLPQKWGNEMDPYLDPSEGVNQKACNHITAFQASGNATFEKLEKASRNGVYKSLGLPNNFIELQKADLVGGRTVTKGEQKYYEFDMAVAPTICDSKSADNLGLGFCPYESIYLLSSTVYNNRLYALIIECEKSQWKRSNAELRQVRSSFVVETLS